jgi:hypothetical protein
VRELSEDGLAADHDEITLVGDRGGRTEDVLGRGAIQRPP